jgi:serine/threonine-protein phosphatase 2A activator
VFFVQSVNQSLKACLNCSIQTKTIPAVEIITDVLELLNSWTAEIPPVIQATRYGNTAFRIWYARLKQEGGKLLAPFLNGTPAEHGELVNYFYNSFGSPARIDYGTDLCRTGHELSFVCFLCSLYQLKYLPNEDLKIMGLFVFKKYLGVVRNLQKTYCMEPAGSQGVWGLDDFQFLPFLWGSSQMIACPPSTLKSISSPEFCKKEGGCNLFLEAVAYVHASKSGPFFEHSPVLYEISQSDSWDKVNRVH